MLCLPPSLEASAMTSKLVNFEAHSNRKDSGKRGRYLFIIRVYTCYLRQIEIWIHQSKTPAQLNENYSFILLGQLFLFRGPTGQGRPSPESLMHSPGFRI